MLDDKIQQQDGVVVDKYVDCVANYQMKTYDYVVRPRCSHVTASFSVTLPPVAEAKGRWYSIVCRDAEPGHVVTVHDRHDSECWPGDVTLDGECDSVLAYSDGYKWFIISVTTYTGSTSPTTSGA